MKSYNCAIILNYNDWSTTKTLVSEISRYDVINKIVIVDNNSTDDSYSNLLKLSNEKISVIKTDENRGYAYGNNFGMRYAEKNGEYDTFIICNPDIHVSEDVIKKIIMFLYENNEISMASCEMKDVNNTIIKSTWTLPTYLQCCLVPLPISSKMYNFINKKLHVNKITTNNNKYKEVEVMSGSFFIVKSKIMKQVNYFDEDTFLYCEENLLAMRMKRKGYKLGILLGEFYIHEHSISINKSYHKKIERDKLCIKSYRIFLKNALKCSKVKLYFFNIISMIGIYERKILYKIQELIG